MKMPDHAQKLIEQYGLASVLMSLIETAPGWSLGDVLQDTANEWVVRLRTPGETSPALHCRSQPHIHMLQCTIPAGVEQMNEQFVSFEKIVWIIEYVRRTVHSMHPTAV